MHIKCMHSEVFSVSGIAEIVPRIPCVSADANALVPARDAKGAVVAGGRGPWLSRPASGCWMSSGLSWVLWRVKGRGAEVKGNLYDRIFWLFWDLLGSAH